MSAPKVKYFDSVSTVLGFLLPCCSAKATGNRKTNATHKTLTGRTHSRTQVSCLGQGGVGLAALVRSSRHAEGQEDQNRYLSSA
jgi:hypothetical protein